MTVLQKGGPLPRPESRLLSNTQKWIVWEDTCGDQARDFIGKEDQGGEQQGEGTQENSSATWLTVSGFLVMGLGSGLSSTNHSDSRVLPGIACLVRPRWMPVRRILGGGWTCGISFWPFPNSSSWWWFICSMFFTRTSCHKTVHAMVTRVSGQGGRFQSVCSPWQLQLRNRKTLAPWKKSYDKPREHIKKQRHYFTNKGLYSQRYFFFFK